MFVGCTGGAALLIEKNLGVDFEDWSQWLPCDSALAVPSTRGNTHNALYPLYRPPGRLASGASRCMQHRTGNGMVYSSCHWSDDQARKALMRGLDVEALAEPRLIRFRTGRRGEQ